MVEVRRRKTSGLGKGSMRLTTGRWFGELMSLELKAAQAMRVTLPAVSKLGDHTSHPLTVDTFQSCRGPKLEHRPLVRNLGIYTLRILSTKPRDSRSTAAKAATPLIMGFISGILYVVILILNAMCILSEDRFLARINLSPKSIDPAFGQSGADASVWSKVASLISSVRMVVRFPLIFVNAVIIVYELILG
ncbi:Protein transport protein YOS1 [Diaporthe amygdali]|nr:Protein transport protein YOS1 [Diaporthe amygdali]KAJ0121134.1 Protein transport protein YOS1 [Diaporthe amygdali]